MPFTPSHAIVALPFIRTPLIPAAIAIGAMTPDLPLFLRGFGVSYWFTHEPVHILWTAVIALALFLLWRVVLRPVAGELSPAWLARRLPEEWDRPAWVAAGEAVGRGQNRWYPLMLAVSLVLGVISHIVWDAFTHVDRWGSEALPILDAKWGPLQGFKWLQYASGVLGLVVIAVWALLWLRRASARSALQRRTPPWVRILWWVSLPVVLIVSLVLGYIERGPLRMGYTIQHLLYQTLPPGCGIWAMLTLAICVSLVVLRRDTPGGPHGFDGRRGSA